MKTTYKSQKFVRVADNLYRNGEDKYYARLYHNGKSYKKCLDTHDRKTADRKLIDYEKEVERKALDVPDFLFEKLAEQWLATIKSGLKEMSHRRRQTSVNSLLPFFKGTKIREIQHSQFERWQSKRAKVSAQTFNIDRETLSMIFEYARKLKIVQENPVKEIKKRKGKKRKVIPPTREQFQTLLQTIKDNIYAKDALPLIEFLAYTGQRLNEALQMKWKDVDFIKDKMRITGGIRGPKNSKERVIPLFPKARVLLLHISGGKEMPANDTIFHHKSSKTALKRACKAMGLEEDEYYTHHSMRHYFASNALEIPQMDFATLAFYLGHSDGGKLAASTYGHLRQSHSDDLAKLMA